MEDPFFSTYKPDYVKCLKALFSMYENNQIHTLIGNEKVTFFNEAGY